ncbi:MAG: carboxypeptidase regulatory-like domain-containing protein [Gemmatimonadota bacterium]
MVSKRMRRLRWTAALVPFLLVLFVMPRALSAQVVEGMIFDDVQKNPVAGVRVRLLDASLASVDSTATDKLGRFRLSAPADGTYTVAAEYPGYVTTLSSVIQLTSGAKQSLLLPLRRLERRVEITDTTAAVGETTAGLVGRIVEEETGRPVEGVEIRLEPGSRVALSGIRGFFWLDDVPPGRYHMTIQHIGYATLEKDLVVQGGKAYDIRVKMDPKAIPLEGLEVTVRSRAWFRKMRDVQFRMAGEHGGIFFTREDFKMRGYPRLSQMLRGLPGVKVREAPGGRGMVTFRGCTDLSRRVLPPTVWIDGLKIRDGGFDINMVASSEIDLVEIYRSTASVPAEFSGSDGRCGAIIIWTKRGR